MSASGQLSSTDGLIIAKTHIACQVTGPLVEVTRKAATIAVNLQPFQPIKPFGIKVEPL
jgi:hypothetical protein